MRFTVFPDMRAATKTEVAMSFEALCDAIATAPPFASKTDCRWISCGVYGDTPNENGCLRHAGNLLAVTGLEGDYDAECVSIDEAADMARAAGVRCVLYTSASHRPEAPRWRVIAPLSREHAPTERAALIDRLNGVFGGVLTPESWNLSQAFLIGRVQGAEYECRIV